MIIHINPAIKLSNPNLSKSKMFQVKKYKKKTYLQLPAIELILKKYIQSILQNTHNIHRTVIVVSEN